MLAGPDDYRGGRLAALAVVAVDESAVRGLYDHADCAAATGLAGLPRRTPSHRRPECNQVADSQAMLMDLVVSGRMGRVAKSRIPDSFYDGKVLPRTCDGPPSVNRDEAPPHPRPAGVDLELLSIYAADYFPGGADELRPQSMDLRPMLDALAARWDGCSACSAHHSASIATSASLTTHIVGVALLASNIREAPARLVLQMLDPDGCALALTIRNSGLEAAATLAESMDVKRRQAAVAIALGVLVPASWLDMPVSNLCPPSVRPARSDLGDVEILKALRSDGYLP